LLVAILPHISDFASKLDLPIAKPVTTAQVLRFNASPYKGHLSGSVVLTNRYWFFFDQRGFVGSFTAPNNFFTEQDLLENLTNYMGHTTMTTNEIVAFARQSLLKLGYPTELTHSDTTPELRGPSDLQRGGHIPYCRVVWKPLTDLDSDGYSEARVDINTQDKSVVGLYLMFARTNKVGTPLKLDVEPELESDFRKRTKVNLFIRSNAPPTLPQK
jgi:hypothetical protein